MPQLAVIAELTSRVVLQPPAPSCPSPVGTPPSTPRNAMHPECK
jgi:hypothetical protein